MMLIETFSTLHEEHVGMFRGELKNLRRITQELEAVRGELETSTATPAPMRLGSASPAIVRNGHGRKNADGNKHAALASGLGLARTEHAHVPSTTDADAAPGIQADAARIKPPPELRR